MVKFLICVFYDFLAFNYVYFNLNGYFRKLYICTDNLMAFHIPNIIKKELKMSIRNDETSIVSCIVPIFF